MNWFLSLFTRKPSYFTGVTPDTRLPSEKAKDWLHEERFVVGAADPFANPQMTISPYPYENQLSTSECVPHAVTLAEAIERKNQNGNFALLSPTFPYRLRFNYPQPGSAPQNIYEIIRTTGAPLFASLPTPQYESQANTTILTQSQYNEAAIYKGLNYFTVQTPNNITTLAQITQDAHAVTILLYANEDEYSRQYPTILHPSLTYAQAEVQHEVTILPYSGFTLNGVRYVAVQDSAWFGGYKLRYLSNSFITARVIAAHYWMSVNILASGPKPIWVFTKTARLDDKNTEVLNIQKLLISEGLLPSDCATGLFGGLTLAGVRAFQMKYAAIILFPQGLSTPTNVWGNGCIAQANKLCATQ